MVGDIPKCNLEHKGATYDYAIFRNCKTYNHHDGVIWFHHKHDKSNVKETHVGGNNT